MEYEFIEKGPNHYELEFESNGKEIFNINRTSSVGGFIIYAKIGEDNISYAEVANIKNKQNLLFILDIPEGIKVKMVSYSKVTEVYANSVD